jgi:chitinase
MLVSALAFVAGLASMVAAHPLKSRAGSDGNRLTVYWGAEDDTTTLMDVCNDDSYDIVNLAFLAYFFSDGGYPGLSLSGLYGPSQAQSDAGATALQDGAPLVDSISTCQSNGKLVLLSLGGAQGYADVTLTGDDQGEQIATTLWNLFLGGSDESDLRPFGDVKLDGFDLGKCHGVYSLLTHSRQRVWRLHRLPRHGPENALPHGIR